jgi:hypothetical protein
MPEHWLKRDAVRFLSDFGEDVVVVEGSATRTIRAIVDRARPQVGSDGRTLEPRIRIEVVNDAASGIDAAAVVAGQTRVRMAMRPGGEAKDWLVAMPDGDGAWADPGLVRLLLR